MYVYDTCTTFAFCVLRLASSLAHSILMQRHIALAMHAQHFMLAQVPRINSTYRFNTCSAGNKSAQAKRIKVTQQISRGQTMRQIFLLQAVKQTFLKTIYRILDGIPVSRISFDLKSNVFCAAERIMSIVCD